MFIVRTRFRNVYLRQIARMIIKHYEGQVQHDLIGPAEP